MHNCLSNSPFLLVKVVVLYEDLYRWRASVSHYYAHILNQSHHCIGRKLMQLDHEAVQDFYNKALGPNAKASREKSLEHHKLSSPFSAGTVSDPRVRSVPDPKYPNYYSFCACLQEIHSRANFYCFSFRHMGGRQRRANSSLRRR